MFGIKFLGLALSALLTITPVNFSPTRIQYPFTRTDKIVAKVTYQVDDLGETDVIGGKHDYVINYTVHVKCSSACAYTVVNTLIGHNINDNEIELYYMSTVKEKLANELLTIVTQTTSGNVIETASNTYNSQQTIGIVPFTIQTGQYSHNIQILFPAENNQMILSDIDSRIDELSDWYFLKNFIMDKDVPSSSIQTVKNYIDNGDYSSAVSYIENYYVSNSVTENQNNETVVNNYTTKQTDLNTYFNTENNFANQIETDFTNQNQNIPLQTTNDEINVSKFTSAANWVTIQFNRLTNNTFGSLLRFSLITGFILALIGRFKR